MHWKTTQICLGLTIFFTIVIQTGFSILCWECNSEYDRRCGDPFRNHTFAITDCSQRFLAHYPNVTASVCRKIVQRIKGEARYIRSCGFLQEDKGSRPCFRKAGTFDVQIEFCHCNSTDGCNTATSLSGHGLGNAIFISTVMIAITRLLLPISQV